MHEAVTAVKDRLRRRRRSPLASMTLQLIEQIPPGHLVKPILPPEFEWCIEVCG